MRTWSKEATASARLFNIGCTNARKAIVNIRQIASAPPDPNPRHRRNLLSHRFGELDDAIEVLTSARDGLHAAVLPPDGETP